MEFFSSFFNFVLDDSKKLSARAITILTILIITYYVDNLTGFSYYYTLEKKFNVVELANKTISDTTLSKTDIAVLNKLRTDAISHKSLKENALNFLQSTNIPLNVINSDVSTLPKPLFWLDILTATWIPVMIMLIGLYQIIPEFFKKRKTILDDSKFTIFLKLFAVEALLYIIAVIQVKVLFAIPILFNRIYLNFILNIVLNIVILLIVYFFADVLPKKKAKKRADAAKLKIANK